ncbi:MAG: hypothetical protein E6J90_50555 [Deltaproteobacteria bacterium]|nr:MAG: hypothetical protein E6J91_47310 [Deltaproteobacteria bacterium]TMQ04779.1 MAG: hypothetical protein E6J90_50555 [Deltaproteobacteria bacterium]
MNKLLPLALSLPLVACVVGSGTDPADDTPGSGSQGSGSNGSGTTAGNHITTNTTWSTAKDVTAELTVDPGVTLTIAAGTTVKFGPTGSITIQGTVNVQGTKTQPVNLVPSTTAGHHGGFSVPMGGQLTMAYGIQVGGGISVNGGKITVTDTRMSQAEGDFLVVGAGTVDVSYSAIGLEPGAGTDSTHCDMHFGGSGVTIKVTHSNISTSSYGLMLYGGNAVDLTYNNWFKNTPYQIETQPGVSADISYGWFDTPLPTAVGGSTLTATNISMNRLPATVAGPR